MAGDPLQFPLHRPYAATRAQHPRAEHPGVSLSVDLTPPDVVFHPFYDPLDPFSDPFDTLVFADPPPAPDGPVDLVELSRRIEILLIGDLLGPGFPGFQVYDTFAEYLDALSPSPVTTGSAPTTNGVVPEPSTGGLLALGTLGVALLRRRSRRAR